MPFSLTKRDEELFELLQVDLKNVRCLMRLLEHHVQCEQPDIQSRVSLSVMGRRLDAIIETSRKLLTQPQVPVNGTAIEDADRIRSQIGNQAKTANKT